MIYATDLFDADTARSMIDRLSRILDAVTAAPHRAIGDVPMLADTESAELTPVSGGPGAGPVVLADLFAAAADRWPDRVAVVDAHGEERTYAELDERSNRLARWLIGQGIGVESLVALAIGRSADLLTAIWAVAKTGAGYVPIDPDYPAARVASMVTDSGAALGLTVSRAGALPDEGFEWLRLDADDVAAQIAALDASALDEERAVVRPDNVAYVIYTSGSTGRPKGVSVTHSGLANFAAQEMTRLGVRADDDHPPRVLGFASPSFDASVLEYLLATAAGGAVIYRADDAVGGELLQSFMRAQRITHTFLTPTVVATLEPGTLPDLSALMAGGEAVPQSLVGAWSPHVAVHNLYGPTETTIGLTLSAPMVAGAPVWLGGPLAGVGLLVLDDRMRPVPVGVTGELYATGVALSRGYLDRPALTAERFVANPYGAEGERMYRTGDVVRWRRDRSDALVVEYSGRSDDQVKLRGLRIELGEIESVLTAYPGVTTAVVVGIGGSVATALAAYLVADRLVDVEALRTAVGEQLPAFMVPSSVTFLDALPLTPVGKLDKAALPEPVLESATHVAPDTAQERTVARVFAEVLGVDDVGATDDFFALGGNSLSATRVVARLAEALELDLAVRDLFEAPTVRALAGRLVAGSGAVEPIVAGPRPDRIRLSNAQQRMWFLNQFDSGSPAYNIPVAMRLEGPLDGGVLRAALLDVMTRHEVLRTVYPQLDGDPVQQILTSEEAANRLDWDIADSERDLFAAATIGFDVTAELPIRARLLQTGPADHVLMLVAHHISADGESMRPLMHDLVLAHQARAAGRAPDFEPLSVQFADVALWQERVLGSADDPSSVLGEQLAYWTDHLAGLPDVLELPTDHPRPQVASMRGGLVEYSIPRHTAERIESLAREQGVTEFMVLHAVLAVLLARLSATQDIAIATPTAGRGQAVLDDLVGMFVNTLVLRTDIEGSATFDDVLQLIKRTDLDALANADVPFEYLVERLDPLRSEAFAPLTQVMLSFDQSLVQAGDSLATMADVAGDRPADDDPTGLRVTPVVDPGVPPARLDLSFGVATNGADGGWRGDIVYAADLFDRVTVRTFADRFVRLLDTLTAEPQRPVGDAEILDRSERHEDSERAQGADVLVSDEFIGDVVARQARRTPSATALRFGDRAVGYAEFTGRVNALARELISRGVGPDVAVGVCMPRSVEMVVAIHAVVTAGGQYVPIDTAAPVERIGYMVDTAGVALVLVAPDATPSALGEVDVDVLTVDTGAGLAGDTAPVTDADRLAPLRPEHAMYTIFTSGSTGRPKGVTLSHEAVLNRLWWGLHQLPIGTADTVVLKTPYTFDCSVPELFAPLMIGAQTLVLAAEGHLDPVYVAEQIAEHRATMVHFVPSMLSVFLELAGPERLATLDTVRILSTTGEALPPAVAAQTRARLPGADLFNLYGPTEAAVEITYQHVDTVDEDDSTTPIGVPVWNSTSHVLDGRLRPVPAGVAGELYVGGVQLARGYAARPDLTAERFVADPFGEPGSRLYRTGDLVRVNHQGELEYLGRTDFQVKLRGQRIELGEIESVLAGAPGVVHAVATVVTAPAGGEHLVAYLAGDAIDVDVIKHDVAQALPEYMRPSVWTVLDDIPRNTAGKLDRRALPEPDFASAGEFVAPSGALEELVAQVFADVLGVDRIGVTESFFDIGGNSLSATRVVARLAEALDAQVPVRMLFDAPSVRELVALVAPGSGQQATSIVAVTPRPDEIPLSLAQQRMWFINRFDPSATTYNIPIVLRLEGDLDAGALRTAMTDVVTRHEILRTTYPERDGIPRQLVHDVDEPGGRPDWAVVDTRADLESAVSRGFDVTSESPVRVRLWSSSADDHILAVVVHHIAADGESIAPLVADVMTAYAARRRGTPADRPALAVQFADYALWQQRELGSPDDPQSVIGRQLDFWGRELAGLPDVLEMPTDRPRPAVAGHRGAVSHFEIPAAIAGRIGGLAQAHAATPFMVVQSALAVLLARLAAADDIAIGTPTAGRGHRVLDDLVGMFVNTLVLRTQVDPSMPFGELIDVVRRVDVSAFEHADVPFEAVVERLNPVRSEAFAPLTQVSLTFDQSAMTDFAPAALAGAEIDGMQITPLTAPEVSAKVDLTVAVSAAPEGQPWAGSIVFATDLFDEPTVATFARRLIALLDTVTAVPEIAVGDVDLLEDTERAQLVPVSGPASDGQVLLGEMFDRSAREWPGREAVVDAMGGRLTYAELDARANRLSRVLIALGVGPDSRVALAIPRSVELMTAIWAVVRAGGAFVPIDPDYPRDRVLTMIDDCGAELGLTVPAVADLTDTGPRWLTMTGDEIRGHGLGDTEISADPLSPNELRGVPRPDNLAYVIYTSGSTGRPKGVAVTHRGLYDFTMGSIESIPYEAGSRTLGYVSPSFDVSIFELVVTMFGGGALIYRPADAVGGDDLHRYLVEQRITHAMVPTSVAATLSAEGLPDLKSLTTGGEVVPQTLVDEWAPHVDLYNAYGPTETTIAVTYTPPLLAGEPVYVGSPFRGVRLVVLDERLRPVPFGTAGELYVVGKAVARGYLGRPGQTAASFVATPYGDPGELMYRTGDVVRWALDRAGRYTIEFGGRSDDQVKLRGLRIELGEIETVLGEHPDVRRAVVLGVGAPVSALAAYVVGDPDLDVGGLRDHLADRLPRHMIPASFTVLDTLPMTPVGKLDKRALPQPVSEPTAYVEPSTESERQVAAVFADILDVDRVSATDGFFDLGGNSLSATRVVSRLRDHAPHVELAWLFSDPTVSGVAARIDAGTDSAVGETLLALRRGGNRSPLFCVHPAGGLAWFYGGLAPYLEGRPIYGLQDPHVVSGEPSAATVDELAARYVEEIRRVAPDGPYHLLGWSLGGHVAHAMATMLQADGHKVAFLGIMDAAAPSERDADGSPAGEAVAPAQDEGGSVVGDMLGGWRDLFDLGDDVHARTPEEVAAVVREQIAAMGLLRAEQVEWVMDSFEAAENIVTTYHPEVFDGPVAVVTATADKADPASVRWSWRRFVTGTIANIDVDAHHLGLADATSLEIIGPWLAERLEAR
ncbi:amino acid adenylation domain-containing protein [Gordonia sp. SID5947]|uniref:non-ribosomal peptide synthetase n=1 Tax=Gordonia sp. SID5947 TaxID=2690315 RepID=UPI0013679F33|nr:non-ribosomal peptide synthetase [Gordonia sp. SID5947]MYR08758.1 amino acid adenylation domain-containing protein [Gordonia sp. SID5947]